MTGAFGITLPVISIAKAQLVAAYKGFVVNVMGRYEELRAPDGFRPFFDEVTLLSGRFSGQPVFTLNPALLYTLDETWKLGATTLLSRSIGTEDFSNLWGPIASFQAKPEVSILGGIGLNRSPFVQSGWSAFLVIQYTLKASLSIIDLPLRDEPYSSLF